jgi:hypothetical protein
LKVLIDLLNEPLEENRIFAQGEKALEELLKQVSSGKIIKSSSSMEVVGLNFSRARIPVRSIDGCLETEVSTRDQVEKEILKVALCAPMSIKSIPLLIFHAKF